MNPISDGERRAGIKLRITPEVSIADLLTVIGIGLPLLIWGARLDARVEQLERQIVELRQEDQRQTAERNNLRTEVLSELREMRKDLGVLTSTIANYNGRYSDSTDRRLGR